MVNAHSHAFQRDLRGAAERPAPEAHAADDFWSWREAMYRLAGAHDPDSMRDGGRPRLRRDGGRRLRRRRRVPLRPPPARRHAVRGPERDGDRGRRGGARRRPRGRAAPDRLPPRGLEPPAHRPGSAASATRTWRRTWRGSTPCAPGPPAATACTSASPRTASARCPRAGWRRSPPTPTSTAWSATSTPTSSRASSRSAAPSTASPPSSCSTAPASSARARSLIHGIHVDDDDVRRLAESGTIVVSCPTTEGSLGDGHFPALVYRDAGVRIAIGSDSNVRVDPFEETRELETLARRERRTRHALLAAYGDLWGELAANGRASLGPRGRRHGRGRPRPPRPARASPTPTCRWRSPPARRPRSCCLRG